MLTIAAHATLATSPTECNCHADRDKPVPQFAAEALTPTASPNAPPIDSIPPVPPNVDPFIWLALVNSATAALHAAADRLEALKAAGSTEPQAGRRRRPRNRRPGSLCVGCAARLDDTGFRAKTMFVVQDISGNIRCMTLAERHAVKIATDKADAERKDFVILTVPGYIATNKHATREVLIRAGRR